MCYVPHLPPSHRLLFPFLSFSFIPSGRRNETRCYKTRGKSPGKYCLQLILYILLAVSVSLLPPLHLHCLHPHFKWPRPTVQSKGSGGGEASSGIPCPDWDRFCVRGEPLYFLRALKIAQSLGLHTVSGSFLQMLWDSSGGKEPGQPLCPGPLFPSPKHPLPL